MSAQDCEVQDSSQLAELPRAKKICVMNFS